MLQELQVNQSMLTVGFCQINQYTSPRIAIVIPARMDSQRLPNKALLPFNGLPMLEHVRRRGELNSYGIPVFVTSGDSQIITTAKNFGGLISFSQKEHLNGTSRVHEFSEHNKFSHFLILQGDEILVIPQQLDAIISSIKDQPEVDFWNMVTPLVETNELANENVVKCLLGQNSEILSIFRKSPLTAEIQLQMGLVHKICGLFAVSQQALAMMSKVDSTPLEKCESIEQLKFLELGCKIKSILTSYSYPSVNLPEDLDVITNILLTDKRQVEVLKKIL
jgi:3-deoxy-manno-octulosonate cytidylyltransferase (CMP-KDO synthetase)